MFGDWDLLIWVAAAVASIIAITRLMIMPLLTTVHKVNKKAAVVQQQEGEELNVKNLTNLAGGAAAGYVDNMIKGLEQGYMQAKDIYEAQQKECAKQNLPPDQAEKILAPLRSKMKQAEWLLSNRGALEEVNKVMTAPLVGRLAKKIIGGLL